VERKIFLDPKTVSLFMTLRYSTKDYGERRTHLAMFPNIQARPSLASLLRSLRVFPHKQESETSQSEKPKKGC
jgi:hypothetical protein